MFGFSDEEIRRYSRQIVLNGVGGKGQKRLRESSVLVIGAGGLGCPAAYYLVAAGIGNVGILDFDTVDISNLQRQILHFTKDVGKPKVISAAEKLNQLNPNVNVETIQTQLTPKNARDIIKRFDYVIDGSDNFATKYIINDTCVIAGIPFTIAGILAFHGQILTVIPGKSACYRCVYITPPPPGTVPSCSQAGVFGAIPGIIGSIQTSEAIKYLLGIGKLLTNKVLLIDIGALDFQLIGVGERDDCKACGKNPEDLLKIFDYYQNQVCET
ncbi:MAG: HesA/MoeB/ThiF family protein [Candidatus Helarchaeota archaeon]